MSSPQGTSPFLSADYGMGNHAPVDFMDLNAGAGPSSEVSRLMTSIHGTRLLQQRVQQEVMNASPADERDWIRAWRKKIKTTVSHLNESLHIFLIKRDCGSGSSPENIAKLKNLVTRITNNIPANSKNYFPELGWDISMNNVVAEVENDLGANINQMKDQHKRVIRLYADTLRELLECDSRINQKLGKMIQMTDKIQGILAIESAAELEGLAEPVAAYLGAVFRNNHIQEDFEKFVVLYKKWIILYDIIQIDRTASISIIPNCCICAEAEITHAMIPCGHTFCSGCIQKQTATCYICRTSIRDRLKLHFP